MSYDYSHILYELMSASDTTTQVSTRELYRRPSRRRQARHAGRRRLLQQHVSCPNTFARSEELSSTSADERGARASRRTRSDLQPLGGARRYKTDRSRYSLWMPRVSSRLRRAIPIVHHPCCVVDLRMCPVSKGSRHRQRPRSEDIDSETLRTTEDLRRHIESFLQQHSRCELHKALYQPEAAAQTARTATQHKSKQMKSAQQSEPREKKCEICGNSKPAGSFSQRYTRQPSPPASERYRAANLLPRDISSETADRLVDELSRRSAGPRSPTAQSGNTGEPTGQQRNPTSAATTNLLPTSPTATGPRKGDILRTSTKWADFGLTSPLDDIPVGDVSSQNMPPPRSTATSPFVKEYFSRRQSLLSQRGDEKRPSSAVKTGPPITKHDKEASYTMHSIASARAATTENADNAIPQFHAPSRAFSYEAGSQPENVMFNFPKTTRSAASEGAKPSEDMVAPILPAKGVFTLGVKDDSTNPVGRVDPEFMIPSQSDPDSARFTADNYDSDASGLQQSGNPTAAAGTSSSNGDFQSGKQTPALSVGSSRHMASVEKALKSWQASGGDTAQANGAHSRTDKPSRTPSVCRTAAADDANHLRGCQGVSPQASSSPRKPLIAPIALRGEGKHLEVNVRNSGSTSHININVARSDDSAVFSRRSFVETPSKPGGSGDTSFRSDYCGNYTPRSNSQRVEKEQEAARNAPRSGTPPADSGCKATPAAGDKVVAVSPASSRASSIAASTKAARRRVKDRGGGDSKADATSSDDTTVVAAGPSHLLINEQVEASRKKIIECIDKALAYIVNSPGTDLSKSGSLPKLQSTAQLPGRSKSPRLEQGDSSDVEPQRECSSLELSSELWGHVGATVRDSLASLPRQRAPTAPAVPPAEDRNNRKLLLKLQRDLTKNILTNLKRLEDIESLLHPSNGEGSSGPSSK